MYHQAYLRTAVQLLDTYNGSQPFGIFIKDFFRRNHQFGSRDRKQVSRLCYAALRTGQSLRSRINEEKILAGLFLTGEGSHPLLPEKQPAWAEWLHEHPNADIGSRVEFMKGQWTDFDEARIFSWQPHLSAGMGALFFCRSHLQQPDMFLRIRPGQETLVMEKWRRYLASEDVSDRNLTLEVEDHCLRLPNGFPADRVWRLNAEVVVQDRNSQRVEELLPPAPAHGTMRAWDVCAASGGKSILLWDHYEHVELTVTDIRKSILHNLAVRFREAGLKSYRQQVLDVADTAAVLPAGPFDLLVCDVPCSGSGTWGRTPEKLWTFRVAEIEEYAGLQRRILGNAVRGLQPGAYLLYITCSVFAEENEQQVEWLQQSAGLELLRLQLLRGYDDRGDTLFASLLRKPFR